MMDQHIPILSNQKLSYKKVKLNGNNYCCDVLFIIYLRLLTTYVHSVIKVLSASCNSQSNVVLKACGH